MCLLIQKKSPVFKMRLIYFNLYGTQYFQNTFTDICLTCPITFSGFTVIHPLPNTEDTEGLTPGHTVRQGSAALGQNLIQSALLSALSTERKVTCENIRWTGPFCITCCACVALTIMPVICSHVSSLTGSMFLQNKAGVLFISVCAVPSALPGAL